VELNTSGFWEQDENFRYTAYVYPRDMAGYKKEEGFGKTRWEMSGDPKPLSGSWADHRADLAAHRPYRDFEYSRVRTDGTIGYYSASGVPIFDDQGPSKATTVSRATSPSASALMRRCGALKAWRRSVRSRAASRTISTTSWAESSATARWPCAT
jgi:PAS domain-containing protein